MKCEVISKTKHTYIFKIILADKRFSLKLSRMKWPRLCVFLQDKERYERILWYNQLGEILFSLVHMSVGEDGIYSGVDFMTYLGAKEI